MDTSAIDTQTIDPGTDAGDTQTGFMTSVLAGIDKQVEAPADTPKGEGEGEKDKAKPDAEKPPGEQDSKDKKQDPLEEEEPKNMTPEAGKRWKELKSSNKTLAMRNAELEAKAKEFETKLAELTTKTKDLEGTASQVADLERLRAQVAEYEGELAISRVEATPEYKRTVVEPMARLTNIADRLAKTYDPEGNASLKERILGIIETRDIGTQRKRIAELVGEWNEGDRLDLYTLSNDYQVIIDRKNQITQNAKDALAQIQERERGEAEQTKAAQTQEWTRAVTGVGEKLKSRFPNLPPEEHEKIRGQITANSFDAEPPEGKAFAAFAAVYLPHALKEIAKFETQAKELDAKVKALQASKPGAGAGAGDVVKQRNDDDKGDNFLGAVLQQLPS